MADFTSGKYDTVFGYFSSETAAEAAVRELHAAGFARNQISIAGRPESEWDTESHPSSRDVDDITGTESPSHPAYHEGHKLGEKTAGFWQRIKNMFEGDSAEPYGEDYNRRELKSHGITDTYDYDPMEFHQSWAPTNLADEHSRRLTDRWERSGEGVLVGVHAGGRRTEAESILEANGADLGRNSTDHRETALAEGDRFVTATPTRSTFATNTTGPTPVTGDYIADDVAAHSALGVGEPVSASTAASIHNAQTPEAEQLGFDRLTERTPRRVQLYGEVLRVHRDRIQRGEVRIRKEIITEIQTVEVPVTREEIVLERIPIEEEQAAPGVRLGEGSEIRIPLSEDQITIERQPVVREQVEIGTREVTNVESRDEPVRREQIVVDDKGRLPRAS